MIDGRIRKIALYVLATTIVFVAFPNPYQTFSFQPECKTYCQQENQNLITNLRRDATCAPPIGGLTFTCLGIISPGQCTKSNMCYLSCKNTCYGLVFTVEKDSNPVKTKVSFFKSAILKIFLRL